VLRAGSGVAAVAVCSSRACTAPTHTRCSAVVAAAAVAVAVAVGAGGGRAGGVTDGEARLGPGKAAVALARCARRGGGGCDSVCDSATGGAAEGEERPREPSCARLDSRLCSAGCGWLRACLEADSSPEGGGVSTTMSDDTCACRARLVSEGVWSRRLRAGCGREDREIRPLRTTVEAE
jgi:hypothetical protein